MKLFSGGKLSRVWDLSAWVAKQQRSPLPQKPKTWVIVWRSH